MQLKLLLFFLFVCKNVDSSAISKHVYNVGSKDSIQSAPNGYIIGPKHMRRMFHTTAIKKSRELQKAQSDHRKLHEKITNLDTPRRARGQDAELKHLKIEKLKLKDKISRLLKELTPNDGRVVELGAGDFGKVLFGHCVSTGKDIAIKVAPIHDFSILWKEYLILQRLNEPGFPRVHHFGKQDILNLGAHVVMVLDVLGPSLDRLFFATTLGARGFLPQTVLKIALELLTRLESLSRHNIVHGDVQPGNFLMGKSVHGNRTIHMIDFGLSTLSGLVLQDKDVDNVFRGANKLPTTQFHRLANTSGPSSKEIRGTLEFSSIDVLRGRVPAEKDDLESLAYCLAYFLCGALPWSKLESQQKLNQPTGLGSGPIDTLPDISSTNNDAENGSLRELVERVVELKANCSAWEICQPLRGAPCPAVDLVMKILCHARSLSRDVKPDYPLLKAWAQEAFALASPSPSTTPPYRPSTPLSQFSYDWEVEGLHWSDTDGLLVHDLYDGKEGP